MREIKGFQKQWRERFETFANSSDNDAGIAGWSPSGLSARFRHFKRRWTVGNNGYGWLDAGCGAGTYSRYMAEQGAAVVGVDYSVPSLVKALQRSSDSMKWSAADVTKLPFKNACFNGAICFGVTQTLDDSKKVTAELLRIVKPEGEIWIDALNANCLPHTIERVINSVTKKPIQMRYETPRHLLETVKKLGAKNVKIHWLPILPQRLQQFQWIVELQLVIWLFHLIPPLGTLFSHAFVVSATREKDV